MTARKLDPRIAEILKKHNEGHDACWLLERKNRKTGQLVPVCWILKHDALERIAAAEGIKFHYPPTFIEANGDKGIFSICVEASLGPITEWSTGEASASNNKNEYPLAMAEKRAKDRVALKLLRLHGIVYSDVEADFQSDITEGDFSIPKDDWLAAKIEWLESEDSAEKIHSWRKSKETIKIWNSLTDDNRKELIGALAKARMRLEGKRNETY